ncbi:MAG: BPSS1780 family membrane protein [Marinicella sp.]|nr:hypothetical protein [Xanthomonadales bacterium]
MHQYAPNHSHKPITWKHGKQWLEHGLITFKAVKMFWYFICFVLAILMSSVELLAPSLVPLLVVFTSPFVAALMMAFCQKQQQGSNINPAEIGQMIYSNSSSLMILGLLGVVLSLFFQYLHDQLLIFWGLPTELTQTIIKNMAAKEALIRTILNIFTNLPLAVAFTFSPALILFNQIQPFTAIQSSFSGVMYSWKAFVVLMLLFILVFMVILLFAGFVISTMMMVFGAASNVFIEIMVFFFILTFAGIAMSAQYHAYIDIYGINQQDDNPDEEMFTVL